LPPTLVRLLELSALVFLLELSGSRASAQKPETVRTVGDVVIKNGLFTVKGARATLVIGKADSDTYRLTAEVKPADRATRVYLQVMPADPTNPARPAGLHATFYRDAAGLKLHASTYQWDEPKRQWGGNNDDVWYNYWPAPGEKAALELVKGSGIGSRRATSRTGG
jgi:hypothetical protein